MHAFVTGFIIAAYLTTLLLVTRDRRGRASVAERPGSSQKVGLAE
jgi:hypothetical protein